MISFISYPFSFFLYPLSFILSFPYLVLDSFDVAAAQALYFTPELKVAFNLIVIQNTEAINDCNRPTGTFDHFVRIKLQILLMSDRKNNGINPVQCFFQILLDTQIFELFLTSEEPFQTVVRRRILILFFEFPPVQRF